MLYSHRRDSSSVARNEYILKDASCAHYVIRSRRRRRFLHDEIWVSVKNKV